MQKEVATSGISREELMSWGGVEVFNQAVMLCNAGDVSDVTYDDETLVVKGKIAQPNGWAMPVSFRLERGRSIHSDCPCVTNQRFGMVCEHVVAIGLALHLQELDAADAAQTPPAPEADEDNAADAEQFVGEVPLYFAPSAANGFEGVAGSVAVP